MTSCWIVTEGMAGTENQCLGVTDALGIMPVVKRVGLTEPWRTLSPWLGFERTSSFSGDDLLPPWPDLLIASGRKSIAVSRYVKKQSKGRTFTVQIQDPRCAPSDFDLVAVPAHDSMRGPNVIVTDAAPNRITQVRLAEAREDFSNLFSALRTPRVAVLVGGNSQAYKMTPAIMSDLAAALHDLSKTMGLMITTSRRTGASNQETLRQALTGTDTYIWDGQGRNPYLGMLAWADYIAVTADSVSMISEAATTGKPVYMIPLLGGSRRFGRFHSSLLARGIIRLFEGRLQSYSYPPLSDAVDIAREIRSRWGNRA